MSKEELNGEPNYETKYCNLMDALKRSRRDHGDCDSGKRYDGKPLACSACMANRYIDEEINKYKGWRLTTPTMPQPKQVND